MSSMPPYEALRRCSRLHHAASTCKRCEEACPVGAIRIVNGNAVLVAPRCTGCGACSAACPEEVFIFTTPDDAALFKSFFTAARIAPAITIACNECADTPTTAVHISCLLRLEPGHLATTAAAGATSVTLMHGHCVNCPKKGSAGIARLIEKSRILLGAFKTPLEIKDKSVKSETDANRRFLFTRIARNAAPQGDPRNAETAREIQSSVVAEAWQHVPEKHQRTSAALRLLAQKNGTNPEARIGICMPVITKSCEGCTLCATSCPTGALKSSVSNGKTLITLTPADCTGCGVCADLCYKNAVTLKEVEPEQRLESTPHHLIGKTVSASLFTDAFEEKLVDGFENVPIYRT